MATLSVPHGKRAIRRVAARRAFLRRRRSGSQRGSTLIELLVATSIMGTAVVAIVLGMTTTFTSAGANRQSTTAGIVARDYAEAVTLAASQSGAFCVMPYTLTYTPPTGYSVSATYDSCPVSGAQFQKVVVTVTEPNGKTEILHTVVRAP